MVLKICEKTQQLQQVLVIEHWLCAQAAGLETFAKMYLLASLWFSISSQGYTASLE